MWGMHVTDGDMDEDMMRKMAWAGQAHTQLDEDMVKKTTTADTMASESCPQKEIQARRLQHWACEHLPAVWHTPGDSDKKGIWR
jgi:hypothetical protein